MIDHSPQSRSIEIDERAPAAPQPLCRCVAIVAPGLLGGSMALACRENAISERIVAVARRQETLEQGLAMEAFDSGTSNLLEGVAGADMVILAAPVRACMTMLETIGPALSPNAIVTDVGSTKSAIMAHAARHLGPGRFIGGHPMAGSHRTGIRASHPDMFLGARYLLTPDGEATEENLKRMDEFVRRLGAIPCWMDAVDHDYLVARISQVPHLAACALMECAAGYERGGLRALKVAATGFRDATRIAEGNAEMWTDICLTNPEGILDGIDVLIDILSRVRNEIATRDTAKLARWLGAVSKTRRKMSVTGGRKRKQVAG